MEYQTESNRTGDSTALSNSSSHFFLHNPPPTVYDPSDPTIPWAWNDNCYFIFPF
ncbi:MAG: hypothetical protein IPN18_18435, partial [Ignavibacteriales bacterium]|nr:hypothetical protein [Ignavibacteriales bacterium]